MAENISSSIYLNTASCGIISPKAMNAGFKLYEQLTHNSSQAAEKWRDSDAQHIRNSIAHFLGAKERNIAMIPNFSFGINAVLHSLKGTEKILLYRQDYPSLTDPFLINDFDITWLATADNFQIDLKEIDKLIKKNEIDILAISHVQWLSGYKADLKKLCDICKKHKVILIVDGTQSMGALPIDLSKLSIDIFISSNYKWMNSGFGTGILFMNDAFLEKYTPKIGGHNSHIFQNNQLSYKPSLRSYEPGHLNMFGLNILQAAITEKTAVGIENIAEHNHKLTQFLIDGIRDVPITLIGPPDMENRSSIVFLKDENGLGTHLKENNIVVTPRDGNLRISMHYHNTQTEIQQLIDCLKSLGKKD